MRWVPVAIVAVLLGGCKSERDTLEEERARLVARRVELQLAFDKAFAGRQHATFTPVERAYYDSLRKEIAALGGQVNATYEQAAALPPATP